MTSQCIYPGPHGKISEEHYLPEGLGTFQGDTLLLNRVCNNCNTEIGNRTETQFLRAGPIAFFRWLLGIEGKDGPPPSPFYRGAAGAPAIYSIGRAPGFDYDLLWEIHRGTEEVYPLRQIVFYHPIAGFHPLPVLDSMRGRGDLLLKHLQKDGFGEAKPVRIFASPEEIPWVEDLLRSFGSTLPESWQTTTFSPQKIPLVVELTVTEAHFRAVAKIAFHYTLRVFPDLTGMEFEFEPIKNFIWNGGETDRFVRQLSDQFVANFRRGYAPSNWMHILSVTRSYHKIVAYAQFFLSPRSLSFPYEIQVGRNPSRLFSQTEHRAHQYVILKPSTEHGPVGVMEDLRPANYVYVP